MIKYPNIETGKAIGIIAISDGADNRIDLVIQKLREQKIYRNIRIFQKLG